MEWEVQWILPGIKVDNLLVTIGAGDGVESIEN